MGSETFLEVILAILLPPVGVFLRYGCGVEFWICLLLTVLGYIPGIIYAIYVLVSRLVSSTSLCSIWGLYFSLSPSFSCCNNKLASPSSPEDILAKFCINIFSFEAYRVEGNLKPDDADDVVFLPVYPEYNDFAIDLSPPEENMKNEIMFPQSSVATSFFSGLACRGGVQDLEIEDEG
ncbi:hypothetical protein Bca4012_034206 [Brassica carinata]